MGRQTVRAAVCLEGGDPPTGAISKAIPMGKAIGLWGRGCGAELDGGGDKADFAQGYGDVGVVEEFEANGVGAEGQRAQRGNVGRGRKGDFGDNIARGQGENAKDAGGFGKSGRERTGEENIVDAGGDGEIGAVEGNAGGGGFGVEGNGVVSGGGVAGMEQQRRGNADGAVGSGRGEVAGGQQGVFQNHRAGDGGNQRAGGAGEFGLEPVGMTGDGLGEAGHSIRAGRDDERLGGVGCQA